MIGEIIMQEGMIRGRKEGVLGFREMERESGKLSWRRKEVKKRSRADGDKLEIYRGGKWQKNGKKMREVVKKGRW